MPDLYAASTWIVPVILGITLHEAAHGFVAEKFGDLTARRAGRVTANPIKHIDPIGTILLPALLYLVHSPVMFGYAKPVPVNFDNLTPRYRGMAAVALAGPLTNVLLALISAVFLTRPDGEALSWVQANMLHSVLINCLLAVFNLLPVLPLDGGRVIRALLPKKLGRAYAKTERFGMILLIGVMLLLPGVIVAWVTFTGGALLKTILLFTGNNAYVAGAPW